MFYFEKKIIQYENEKFQIAKMIIFLISIYYYFYAIFYKN